MRPSNLLYLAAGIALSAIMAGAGFPAVLALSGFATLAAYLRGLDY
ncbi:MAG: hypothetical protein ACRD52_00600 [Candidatus Acidiferrales bacterium]